MDVMDIWHAIQGLMDHLVYLDQHLDLGNLTDCWRDGSCPSTSTGVSCQRNFLNFCKIITLNLLKLSLIIIALVF